MAPVENKSPTSVQRPPMSAADKYKSYVRSNSNPIHQFDDNMKDPNNNKPDLKYSNINQNNNIFSGNNNFKDDVPNFFTCYTSYSCTPTDILSVQTNQNIRESTQKPVQADKGKHQVRVDPNNNQLIEEENVKLRSNVQFANAKNSKQLEPEETSYNPSEKSQVEPINKLKNTEFGKPAPNAELINVKNTPRVPSPLIMINDETQQKRPRQRTTSGPIGGDRPQSQYGLAHSSSSPSISSKGSSPSQNESLVLHYFQNSHTYKNLQERQLPGQGPVPKSMLPPPAPPAPKRKPNSNRNTFSEKRNSLPNTKSGDGKSNDWEKVLTKFYQW